MRARVGVVAGMTFLAWLAAPAPAAEKVIWKIGEPDQSDHEFASTNLLSGKPVVVRVEGGGEAKQWPKFHPGSGNGAFGGRPHKFSLVFQLPAPVPHGTFSLDLSLLFRQPRVPAVELEVNGHAGRYYFDPEPMFELGSGDDQFNPLRSIQRRKIALAARWFRAGENVLAISCIDDPPVVTNNRTVGGGGDSGCFYDALALSQDPDAAPREKFEVSLIPTVFFPRSAKGFEEQCWLDVRFPSSWQGGRARVALGDFTVPVEMAKPAEFGEARYSTLVPGDLPAQVARIDVSSTWQPGGNTAAQPQTFSVPFAPARKWKLFYAPSVHLDIGYTDYRPKVAEVHSRNLDALLTVFQAHPTYRFNLDGSWVVEQWLATRSAEQASQLAEHARAGRIGMNALYASFVTDYPSLEEFFRSLYLSHELRAKGIPLECAFITDIPSNSWAVPSVLASAGIRYFADAGNQDRGPLIVHGHWNARSPFWWEGPDGQRVLAWFSSHYHQVKAFFGLPPAIESGKGGVARFLRTYERADYAPDAVLIFGTEVENVPLDYADAAFVERWNAQFAYPQIITCRFAEFFQYLEKNFADRLPVVRGEGGAYWGENFSTFAVPTARDRANQVRATSAETLASVTAALNPALRFPRPLNRDIWTNLLLYAEHTFGSARTSAQPTHDEVIGQLKEKDDQTLRAEGDIDKLMRLGMSQLADRVEAQAKSLIVFNPLSWQRGALVRFQVDAGTTLTDATTNQAVDYEVCAEEDGAQTIRFWAADVPPLGYKVYRLGRGAVRRAGSSGPPPLSVVENRFYKVTLEPRRGAIKSIYDKELGRELVDSSSPYLFNEYLFISGGGSEAGRGRGAEATQLLHNWPWLPHAELTFHHPEQGALAGVDQTPWGLKIRMTATALHTPRIETEILLPNEAKRIEFRNRIQVDLLYAKQASYFAFPWALARPTFRYDIAQGFVDPEKDLLEGACSDWFSVQHWVSAEDDRAAADLAVGGAPLVCLGDINRGLWPRQFTRRSSTVFSYVLHNTWSPKWGGRKSWELLNHYAITSGPSFDPLRAARLGREIRCPLEVAEIKASDKLPESRGDLPAAGAAFAALAPDHLVITALKAAEEGEGLIVRVLEVAGRESDGVLQLPLFTISSAREANAVEVPGKPLSSDAHSVRFHIGAHQSLTLRLEIKGKP